MATSGSSEVDVRRRDDDNDNDDSKEGGKRVIDEVDDVRKKPKIRLCPNCDERLPEEGCLGRCRQCLAAVSWIGSLLGRSDANLTLTMFDRTRADDDDDDDESDDEDKEKDDESDDDDDDDDDGDNYLDDDDDDDDDDGDN